MKRAVTREALEPPPSVRFILDSDAYYCDETVSGIGG